MTVPIPREVSRPEGCDCAGTSLHLTTCALMDLPLDQRLTAVDVAERCRQFCRDLSAQVFGSVQ
jgi:hypothetical protein